MKTVCISGGSSGLGKALVKVFLDAGRRVVVLARDKGKLEILQAELHSDYLEIIPCDIKDKKQLSEIIPRLEADIFINNAGIGYRKNTYEESLEEIEDTIVTNLTAAMRCSRLITPAMIAQKSGIIVNIGSVRSVEFRTGASAYAASKAGLKMYSDVLREEMREFGVKVICVYPAAIKTPIWTPEEIASYGDQMMEPDLIAQIIYNACKMCDKGVVQEEIHLKPPSGNLRWAD